MSKRTLISIALVSLFISAMLVQLYKFREQLGIVPPSPEFRFAAAAKRGSEAFKRGEYDQAAVAWDEAIRLAPNHSESHRWRGDASLNRREFDRALSEYETAIRLNPNNAMAYVSQGMAWTEKREPDKAIAAFQRAVELKPELADTPHYRRYAAAVEWIRSTTQNPKFAAAAKRGLAAFGKRDFAQAIVEFDDAIQLDPDHSETRRWRGDAFLNRREFDQALSAYDDAIRLDPKNGMAYLGRGAALTAKRKTEPARVAFETAVQLDPQLAKQPLYDRNMAKADSLSIHVRRLLNRFGLK